MLWVHSDCIVYETEVRAWEIESSIYTQIPGRDKSAVRIY